MKETTGHVEISAHCPLVKITNFVAKADYKISNKEGQATLTVGDVKKVDLSWTVTKDLAKVHLITPFNSIHCNFEKTGLLNGIAYSQYICTKPKF